MNTKQSSTEEIKFHDPEIADIFAAYPEQARKNLLKLRSLIFETAAKTAGVGEVEETLKWNQPSYITPKTRSGSTIRIDRVKNGTAGYAIYFHCQTNLVDSIRLMFGDTFRYEGNRALLFNNNDQIPFDALRECIAMALTYRLKK